MMTRDEVIDALHRGETVRDTELMKAVFPDIGPQNPMLYAIAISSKAWWGDDIPQGCSFTDSLDATLALMAEVLPGWQVMMSLSDRGAACVIGMHGVTHFSGEAPTLAAALCMAILRAKEEMGCGGKR